MYWRMIANGAPPDDAAKYDGDHRCLGLGGEEVTILKALRSARR